MSRLNFDIKTEEERVLETDLDSACKFDPVDLKCQSQIEKHTSSHRKVRKTKRLNVKRTYGLRPRTQIRRPSYECDLDDKDAQSSSRKEPSGKVRGSIVAKCRRLTANARERQRMQEINDAFVTLQGILPVLEGRRQTSASVSAVRASMTKIRTLRHAASYIQALSDLLSGAEGSIYGETERYSGGIDQKMETNSHDSPCNNNNNNNTLIDATKEADQILYPKQQQQQRLKSPPSGDSITWSEVDASDEELFSLLEKEVLSMRKQSLSDGSDCDLGGINWSDDLPPLG